MEWLMEWGYLGLFVAAFLAATIIPFSSDIILSAMLFGDFDPWLLWISASIGNWLGGMLGYSMGYLGKTDWLEKYLGMDHEKVSKMDVYAKKYGSYAALVTWLPVVGDPLAIALGFFKTRFVPTMFWMLIGKSGRYAAIIWLTLQGIDLFSN